MRQSDAKEQNLEKLIHLPFQEMCIATPYSMVHEKQIDKFASKHGIIFDNLKKVKLANDDTTHVLILIQNKVAKNYWYFPGLINYDFVGESVCGSSKDFVLIKSSNSVIIQGAISSKH